MPKSAVFLAPAAAALALAAPGAPAMPVVDAPNHNSPAQVAAPAPTTQPSAAGFDWGSAAIGAGGVAGLIVLISAGAAATGRVRVAPTR